MIGVSDGRGCDERANEISGLQAGVKVMVMLYEKDDALRSPTSALERKLMLSCLGRELGNPS